MHFGSGHEKGGIASTLLPIRAMQEADHPEAASKDLVDSFLKKKQQLDEARPEALSKNRFRRIQRKCN